ncbi:basic leucine zipper transcriptional factor ATF-like 2 [Centropristis striata]|uniref:basic leucine zipper transcriptional factor ATF-like 2 n=1 Tax=Centropristis striata TaxID=184440 RepID=UPI0027DFE289|nr:basic leucine zipper transcriptional factor ATF-like 2 [Centropristis striata]
MSPLFMDTVYELNSPDSLSAEESHSNNAESEREAEGQQTGHTSRKRQEKNRDAARKSRKKQTERADELHEELQNLERSNTALKKEIATLKKDLHLYTTALERHQPVCCLKTTSASCQAGPSPPRVPPHASSSTFAAAASLSTSLTSKLDLQNYKRARLSPSTPPTTTTLASSSSSSPDQLTSSSSVTAPSSVSFLAAPAPHSLFSQHPTLITPRPENVAPLCTNLVSRPVPSSSLVAATQPQSGQDTIHENSLMAASTCFSPLHSALEDFLLKQTSFVDTSSNAVPPYSHLEAGNAGLVVQGCSMNVPLLNPGQFSRNPINSSPQCSLLPPALKAPAVQTLSAPPPAAASPSRPSRSRPVTFNPTSLLSLLTVPSPLDVPQTTSSSIEGHFSQTLQSLGEPPRDLSLSELLEGNDWILSGNSHQ